MKRLGIAALATLGLALAGGLIPAARADGRVGVWLGFGGGPWWPGYYGPRPYYYAPPPPPAYYPPPGWYPPPGYYPPPAYYAPAGPPSWSCYAGPYMCQLDQAVPAGAPCSCPVNGRTRVSGYAR